MSDADSFWDGQEPTRLSRSDLTETSARQGETPTLKRLGDFALFL